MTMKEKKKGKVTQHQHQCQKGVEIGVKIEQRFFGDVNKEYTLVFGGANELAFFGDVNGYRVFGDANELGFFGDS